MELNNFTSLVIENYINQYLNQTHITCDNSGNTQNIYIYSFHLVKAALLLSAVIRVPCFSFTWQQRTASPEGERYKSHINVKVLTKNPNHIKWQNHPQGHIHPSACCCCFLSCRHHKSLSYTNGDYRDAGSISFYMKSILSSCYCYLCSLFYAFPLLYFPVLHSGLYTAANPLQW